ncbi:uncharacterized protein PHALS_01438 [Plasmopara halstedii]|uniref:Uncharacterized protein n=1 Tax=Plasmopara halstedii TaxID=4781 RepID=A0A0P1AV95_PLAHL|nr:uncharacterized protein PHALS_01438 [Plasmopara halstedii]CEG45116.1 hypothetical protein PHALS_01438 [Plasmopara halstedii]|eukprot:XP_024581485.1 hypothetical protein PHALS_01438 [Plasmopara halstedii]
MRLCLVKQPDEIGPDSNSGPGPVPVEGDPPAALVILGDEQDGSTLCKIPDMRRSTHESSWICPPRNDVVQSGLK